MSLTIRAVRSVAIVGCLAFGAPALASPGAELPREPVCSAPESALAKEAPAKVEPKEEDEPLIPRVPLSEGGSPYRIRWEFDVPISGLALAGTMTTFIGFDPPDCLPNCTPPASLNGLDALVVGNYNRGAHGVANAMVLTMLYAPMALDLADSKGVGFLEDMVVFYESILVSQMFTQIMKSATSRDAPLVYNPNALDEDLESADAGRSFWSGHTSTSFAAAAAYATTFWLRNPDSAWRFVVVGVAGSLAATVAALKIEAGYHYPTDVIAGGLAGAAIGVAVPMMHTAW